MTAGPSTLPSGTARVLTVCDGLLREIGRRQHRFSWLRDPAAPDDEWLVVDGYYPANRLVVYTGDDLNDLSLYRQLVPQHGLYLLSVEPRDLPDDPIAAQAVVRKQLEDDGWSPRPESRPVAAPSPPAKSRESVRPGSWTDVSHSAAPSPDPKHPATAGFGLGLMLFAVVLLEVFLGIVVLAIESGDVVLGLGLVLDAAARALGTLSARQRRRQPEQLWSSLLIGSPVVAGQDQPAKGVAIAALVLTGFGVVLAVA